MGSVNAYSGQDTNKCLIRWVSCPSGPCSEDLHLNDEAKHYKQTCRPHAWKVMSSPYSPHVHRSIGACQPGQA